MNNLYKNEMDVLKCADIINSLDLITRPLYHLRYVVDKMSFRAPMQL